MATRKPKRFDEGGITEGENANIDDDVRARAMKFVRDREENPGMYEAEPEAPKTPVKPKAKPKAAPAAEAKPALKYQSLQDRAKSYEDARAKSGVGMYGTKKSEPKEERKALPLKSTKSESGNKFMGSTGLKSGGSVKGWGQARGARKAKMY